MTASLDKNKHIGVHEETKMELDKLREYKNESYDEVIRKVIYIVKTAKTQPKRSRETFESIEKARRRIRQGRFVTEAEAKKRLGF